MKRMQPHEKPAGEVRETRDFMLNCRINQREKEYLEATAKSLFGGTDRGAMSSAVRYLINKGRKEAGFPE